MGAKILKTRRDWGGSPFLFSPDPARLVSHSLFKLLPCSFPFPYYLRACSRLISTLLPRFGLGVTRSGYLRTISSLFLQQCPLRRFPLKFFGTLNDRLPDDSKLMRTFSIIFQAFLMCQKVGKVVRKLPRKSKAEAVNLPANVKSLISFSL